MKRKSVVAISTLLIASSLLASCGGGGEKVSFGEYWYKNSSVRAEVGAEEILSYDVSFTPGSGISKNYELAYSNGEYSTSFKLVEENGKKFYRLSSTLTIDVTYTFGGNDVTFTDTTSSLVEFEANTAFTPIKSEKHVVSHSPRKTNDSTELSGCYDVFDYSATVVYNGASGTSTVVNNTNNATKSNSFELDDADDYTYIDNEQLYFALRALQPTARASTLLVYAPFSKVAQQISATFGSKVSNEKFKFVKNSETMPTDGYAVEYVPITIALAEKNPGSPQLIKVATTNDADRNTNRNLILEIQTPLAYNLGTLTYKLKSAKFFN